MKNIIIAFTAILMLTGAADARTQYSGKHHSASHGGHYRGGQGSSHSGGRYRHVATSNRYGRHR